jgi:NAD(P)-dependent dehydrogenase (short-subunit alcohol dehydrogenase family)
MNPLCNVLIIGASRGLGLALAREWLQRRCHVVATVRATSAPSALHDIAETAEGRLRVEPLDMTDPGAVASLRQRLSEYRLDVLFVNAGVANGPDDRVDRITTEDFIRIMVTNTLSPMRVVETFDELVRPQGVIAVMSSSLGSVGLNEGGGWEVYRASKAALNTLMRSYAARHAGDSRSLALVCPGWVRTDMGGPEASLTVEESVPRVVDAVMARRGKPGLLFFNYENEIVPW